VVSVGTPVAPLAGVTETTLNGPAWSEVSTALTGAVVGEAAAGPDGLCTTTAATPTPRTATPNMTTASSSPVRRARRGDWECA
jgi:hypothetical protein